MNQLYSVVLMILVICFTNISPITPNSTEEDFQMAREAFTKLMNLASQNGVPVDESYANNVMDTALQQLFDALRQQNMERMKVPGIDEEFSKKIGPVKMKAKIQTKNGWAEGFTDIHRKGHASMTLDGSSILFDAALELDELRLEMDYSAKIPTGTVKGKLGAKIRGNSVKCSGGLKFSSGKCRVVLNSLELTNLGKMKVHATGLGPLNWLYSKIVTLITAIVHDQLKASVVEHLTDIVEGKMNDLECLPELMPQ